MKEKWPQWPAQKQVITLSIHMTDVNTENFLTDWIRNSFLCHSALVKGRQKHVSGIKTPILTLRHSLYMTCHLQRDPHWTNSYPCEGSATIFLLHLMQANFSGHRFGFPSFVLPHQHSAEHIKRAQCLWNQIFQASFLGVLDTHRFNFHSEVSILRCTPLSELVCGIWVRRSAIFSKNPTVFSPRAGDETGLAGPWGMDLNQ